MKYRSLIHVLFLFIACNEIPDKNLQKDSSAVKGSAVTIDTESERPQPDTAGTPAGSPSSNKLIIAGKSVGNVLLGMNDSLLVAEFHKPDMSDAAMGKAWLTWYGKKPDEHNNKTRLDVYTTYKDTSMREKTVQQIRTTSSFFETGNGIHVYSSFNDVQPAFPELKKAATYKDDGREFTIYDDEEQGIAFEIVSAGTEKICTGIIVHKRGAKVTAIYVSLYPDIHIVQ